MTKTISSRKWVALSSTYRTSKTCLHRSSMRSCCRRHQATVAKCKFRMFQPRSLIQERDSHCEKLGKKLRGNVRKGQHGTKVYFGGRSSSY
jgi:hypothetical protein